LAYRSTGVALLHCFQQRRDKIHRLRKNGREILSIRRQDVDLNRHRIFVPIAETESSEQPIAPHLAQYLTGYIESLRRSNQWLFPSPTAKDGHAVDIRKPFIQVVEAAGLDPSEIVRHTLRHTAITHLVQSGVDLLTVNRISGHKPHAMVGRYFHANGAHIEAAMKKLDSRLRVA
jgi:integrase